MERFLAACTAFALLAMMAAAYLVVDGGLSARADGSDAKAGLRDGTGANVGKAKLEHEDGVIVVKVDVHGLAPGFHGFHVHAVGTCTAPSFTSAGGHLNPAGVGHPAHAGDMPVLLVNADGTGEARFETDRYSLSDLFDGDGSALIVHANPDNYANIPTARYDPDPDALTLATGDAGARSACGVIEGD